MKDPTLATHVNFPRSLACSGLVLLVAGLAALSASAQYLRWDANPATPDLQDGAGNWSNAASNTNWWDGTQNVAWIPGAIAVVGSNLTAAATITLTNPIVAGGLILSNNIVFTTGTAVPTYTFNGSSGSTATNLTLTGSPALILHAANYTGTPLGASGNETFNVSLIATGGLQFMSATPWVAQASFNNTTNFINGTMEIGTPGNASYTTPTALQAQFNSSGIGAGALYGCSNMVIHSNASVLLRGGSGAFPLNWPKKFIVSGDGIPNSSFSFAAVSFSGNNGSVFPADIQLVGDSTIAGAWGVNNVVLTNSGNISGTGRLRFSASPNRPTSGTVVFKGKHTYVGDTIFDGTMTVQLASGLNDRLPTGTYLKLGTTGMFYGSNPSGVPQSGWNGYGRLVLGDSQGAVNQTLAGLTNDATLNTVCWVIGGNASTNSFLTLNGANDSTYNARLGGTASPDKMLGLIKSGASTLNLQGTNLCAGGYTVNGGALVIGDGNTDNPLSGPLTNNASFVLNVASSLTYADAISGSGKFTKGSYGTLTLTGTNSSTGAMVVQSGKLVLITLPGGGGPIVVSQSAELQVNRTAATGSVQVASAALDSATLDLDLGYNLIGPTATAVFNVAGTFTNNGYTTVNILRSGALSVGRFPLIKYGAYQSNDYSSLALSSFAPGITASLQNNATNSSIDLVISQIAGSGLKWTGATDGNWDNSTTNWLNTSSLSPSAYTLGDFVLFDDSASGSTAITINSDPQPNSLTISNVTKPYSFSGFAGIGGPAALVKQGGGILTVAVNNNNVGGTQIQGGTLKVGDGTTDGTITAPVVDNSALVFNVTASSTAADISGSGSLAKTGPGQLNLGGTSTYQGPTTIQQGMLYVQSATALGGTNGGTTVQAGGEVWVDVPSVSIPEPLNISGAGISGSGGALNASANAVASTWSGPITVASNASISAVSGSSLTLGTIKAGTNSLVFQPNGSATITVSSNVTAGTVQLNDSGTVRLSAPNNLTNLTVLLPGGGLWAYDSAAFGTNSTVLVTNATTPGSYARLGIANNVSVPTNVTYVVQVPGGGVGSPASYRVTLDVGAPGDTNNVWNGSIRLYGEDPSMTGVPGYFIIFSDNGQAVINGNITEPPGQAVNLQLRGAGPSGVINGKINLDTNSFTRTDTALWTIASTGNAWAQTILFNGRLLLGVDEALPASAPVRMDNSTSILDLNGFSQHIPDLTNSGNTAWGSVVNSSTNSASTLIYQGGGSYFGGTISATAGARPLHLDVASGTLTLSNLNNYTGTTTVRTGATLALVGSGALSASVVIDVQAGGTFDLAGLANTYSLGLGQTLKGNGTVSGNLVVAGALAPGESVGTLAISGDLSLGGSAVTVMEVNNTAGTKDVLNVGGTLAYGGTLVITNISGTPYTTNQVLKLFNGAYTGAFANIIFPGVQSYDASKLAVDGTVKVLSVSVVSTVPIAMTVTAIDSHTFSLSWPLDHTGWTLQQQTNPLTVGLSTNWQTVPGSTATNQVIITIDPLVPTRFFRLVYP